MPEGGRRPGARSGVDEAGRGGLDGVKGSRDDFEFDDFDGAGRRRGGAGGRQYQGGRVEYQGGRGGGYEGGSQRGWEGGGGRGGGSGVDRVARGLFDVLRAGEEFLDNAAGTWYDTI